MGILHLFSSKKQAPIYGIKYPPIWSQFPERADEVNPRQQGHISIESSSSSSSTADSTAAPAPSVPSVPRSPTLASSLKLSQTQAAAPISARHTRFLPSKQGQKFIPGTTDTICRPPPPATAYSSTNTTYKRHDSVLSTRGFIDILDAQSEIRPSDFRSRVRASGARDYGEDVAERNLGENGIDLSSPSVQEFYLLNKGAVPAAPSLKAMGNSAGHRLNSARSRSLACIAMTAAMAESTQTPDLRSRTSREMRRQSATALFTVPSENASCKKRSRPPSMIRTDLGNITFVPPAIPTYTPPVSPRSLRDSVILAKEKQASFSPLGRAHPFEVKTDDQDDDDDDDDDENDDCAPPPSEFIHFMYNFLTLQIIIHANVARHNRRAANQSPSIERHLGGQFTETPPRTHRDTEVGRRRRCPSSASLDTFIGILECSS